MIHMKKVKLFRKGKFVGLVTKEFHYPEVRKKEALWDKLELDSLNK